MCLFLDIEGLIFYVYLVLVRMTFRERIFVVHSVRLARDSFFFTREHAALQKICFNFFIGVTLEITFDKKPNVHRVPSFWIALYFLPCEF